jgi:hypothetical protein
LPVEELFSVTRQFHREFAPSGKLFIGYDPHAPAVGAYANDMDNPHVGDVALESLVGGYPEIAAPLPLTFLFTHKGEVLGAPMASSAVKRLPRAFLNSLR